MKPLQGVGAIVSGALKPITGTLGFAGGVVSGFVGTLTGPLVSGLQKAAAAGERAFGGLSQTVLTWVRAGLQGTTTGEQLGVQFQLLSREVANLFIGPLNKLIGGIQAVTNWFRSLDGSTQRLIGSVLTWGVVLAGAAAVIPRVIGGLQGIGAAMGLILAHPLIAVTAALVAIFARTEEGRAAFARLGSALANLFGPLIDALGRTLPPLIEALAPAFEVVANVIATIVEGITMLVNGVREALEFLGIIDARPAARGGARAGQDRQELTQKGGGIEDVRAAFGRFMAAAQRTDPVPSRQLETLGRIEQNTRPRRESGGEPFQWLSDRIRDVVG